MADLKRTALYPLYADHRAKTIAFAGWELPLQFEGILKEHAGVRERAGLFDVSHMGEIVITGADAQTYLQRLTTNDVTMLATGAAQYTLMCYPDGGTVDDLLLYKLGKQRYMAVVNAANLGKDLEWMQKNAEGDVNVTDVSSKVSLLSLQGPAAAAIMAALTDRREATELPPFRCLEGVDVGGVRTLVSRTGYTGEDGFELYVSNGDAPLLWTSLLEAGRSRGLVPVGLGARDTLRFEARLPLYGQELSAAVSPLEAGLGFVVKLDKSGGFIGCEALRGQKENGVPRKLVGIEMVDRGIPRAQYAVYTDNAEPVGEVTTGMPSPTLKTNVGLALIDSRFSPLGTELIVDVRGKRLKAKVVKTPFYTRNQP